MINYREHFAGNPEICNGHTVFKGTRVPVQVVLDSLAEGSSTKEIPASYPTISAGDLQAAIAYAADAAREEEPPPAAESGRRGVPAPYFRGIVDAPIS